MDIIPCHVCGVPTTKKLRHQAYVCESCRRFYMRNKNQAESLICLEGHGFCLDRYVNHGSVGRIMKITNTGTIQRSLCSKCRFDKCVALGMSEKKTRHHNSSQIISEITIEPQIEELSRVEQELARLNVEGRTLYGQLRTLPFRHQPAPVATDAWEFFLSVFMNHTKPNVAAMLTFIRSLPGYSEIHLQDRCVLFSQAFSKIGIAEANSLRHPQPLHMGMSLENFRLAMINSPVLSYIPAESVSIRSLYEEWQPTDIEFNFLLAFLFLSGTGNIKFKDEQAIFRAKQYLTTLYSMTMANLRQPLRTNFMVRAITILQEAGRRRYEAYSTLMQYNPKMAERADLMMEILFKSGS